MQSINKNNILIPVLALLWAIQVAVGLEMWFGLGHAPFLMGDALLPEVIGRVLVKWDLLIYIVFIAVALISGKILFRYFHKPVNPWLLVFEGTVTFLMVSAAFKMMVYDNSPLLARNCLIVLIAVSALGKIFYPECKKILQEIYRRVNAIDWNPYANAWWMGAIAVFIFMPDLQRVIALAYMGDWLHHFDFLLMSVGWASLWGQLPYADVISQYGVGLPMIFANIIHALGSFDYVSALGVMMWFVIIYFVLMYILVKAWLKSALIAGVAFLLVFRLQMFHYGVSPLVWIVGSASPIRFGGDILWLAAILFHLRTRQSRWLVAAAIYSGFALFYMTSVGMSVMASFYVYLFVIAIIPSLRREMISQDPIKLGWFCCSWILPILSAFVFFGVTLKGHIFQKEYWNNLTEYLLLFSHAGALPMWESLKYRHFWAFFMSMVLPFTYMATLLYMGVCLYLEKSPTERLFTAVLCVYGLANYQYYVVRAAITSYYVDVLPFVFIVCFWFARVLELMPIIWQKRLKAAAVFLSFYALLTNQNYLAYPNLINPSRNPITDNLVIQRYPDRQGYFNLMYKKVKEEDKLPMNNLGDTQEDMRTEDDFKNDTELVDYVKRQLDFSQDVGLIQRLTKPHDRVALISSFETKILIEANRPPFFYDFPLLSSRPMTFRSFPTDAAHTPVFLEDTVGAIAKRRPKYVFMEKVFLQRSLPASYYEGNDRRLTRVMEVVDYVWAHYQPVEQGKYLVAMKRKD